MNVLPTWPCTYPVVQQKQELTSKKVKKAAKKISTVKSKKLSKKLSDMPYDPQGSIPFPKEVSNIDLDDPYIAVMTDPILKGKFLSSLDDYIKNLTEKLQYQNLTGVGLSFQIIDDPQDVIGF